jgi:hypothetical protein
MNRKLTTSKIVLILFFLSLVIRIGYILTLDNTIIDATGLEQGGEIAQNLIRNKGYKMPH